MKLSKGASSEDRKKIAAIAVFSLFAIGVLYYEVGDYFFPPTPTPTTAAPAPVAVSGIGKPSAAVDTQQKPVSSTTPSATSPAAGPAAKLLGTTSAALDPTLHMEAMLVTESVEYHGGGRNIFSTNSAPAIIQKPLAAARPVIAPPVIPCPPNCPPPPPPPPPPVIDLKFFGVETSANGTRHAFLLHEDSVFLASVGDVVLRRYRVVSIEARSIRVEDLQYKDTQTLPLLTN